MTKNKPSLRRRVLKEPPASYGGEIVLYQAPDGSVKLDVRLERDTIWLSLNQMALLFERDKSVISRHLRNIYREGELDMESTVAFLQQFKTKGAGRRSRSFPSSLMKSAASTAGGVLQSSLTRRTQVRVAVRQRRCTRLWQGWMTRRMSHSKTASTD